MAKQSQVSPTTKKAVKRKQVEDYIPLHGVKQGKASSNVKRQKRDDGTPTNEQSKAKKVKTEVVKKKTSVASKKVESVKKQTKISDPNKKKKPDQILFGDNKKSKFNVKSAKVDGQTAKKSTDSDNSKSGNSKLEEMTFKDRKNFRKQKKNVNFELTAKLKSLWEELRKANIKPERRVACSNSLFKLVHGRACALMFAHDTSRVFQTLVKYGSVEHRAALLEELKEHLVAIMKSKYAKFFVRKMLKYGTKEQRDLILKTMKSHVTSLVRHREAVSVVEYAYNNFANGTQRATMAGSFYGPSFTIFKSAEEKTLPKFVESHPERRDEIINHMKQSLSPLVDKSVLQHSFVHRLFSDYFTCASEDQLSEMIETLHESVVHMLHTHDGANVAMMCLWHGTTKIRKMIIKSFKSYVVKICKEEFGHMVMLALFDSIDDTRIVTKIILDEMIKSIDELVEDRYGRKVLLYLLMPRDPVYFHPDIVTVLRRGDGNKNSKKDAVLRQSELRSHISPALVKFVAENCRSLVADVDTQSIVMSTIKYSSHDPTAAMKSLALIAAEPFSIAPVESDKTFHHIVDHHNGHYLLKRLIMNDAERIKMSKTDLFSEMLLNTVSTDNLCKWCSCNRGCFVLVSLLELEHPSVSSLVRNQIENVKATLNSYTFKGAQILLKKLTDK